MTQFKIHGITLLSYISIVMLNVQDLECSCNQNICTSIGQLDPLLEDTLISEGNLTVFVDVMSPIRCHKKCLEHDQCVSYFYGEIDKTCQLHSVKFITQSWHFADGQILDLSPGSRYYVLKEPSGTCPDDYIWDRQLNKCYYLHPVTRDYLGSLFLCHGEMDLSGKQLLILDTLQLRENIQRQATSRALSDSGQGYYVDATLGNKSPVWSDGTPINEALWEPGHPKHNKYVFLTEDTWLLQETDIEVPFGKPRGYICEVPLPPEPTTQPETTPPSTTTKTNPSSHLGEK